MDIVKTKAPPNTYPTYAAALLLRYPQICDCAIDSKALESKEKDRNNKGDETNNNNDVEKELGVRFIHVKENCC